MHKEELDNFMFRQIKEFKGNRDIYSTTDFFTKDMDSITKKDIKYLKRAFKFRGYKFKIDRKTNQFKVIRKLY